MMIHGCAVCGSNYVSDRVNALGHSHGEGVITTEVICTEDGVMTYICSAYDENYTETIAATGRNYWLDKPSQIS